MIFYPLNIGFLIFLWVRKNHLNGTLQELSFLLFSFISFSFGIFVFADLIKLIPKVISRLKKKTEHPTKEMASPRREFFRKALTYSFAPMTTALTIKGHFQAYDIQVEKVTLKSSSLPPEFDGFTIAQISDLHIGGVIGRDHVQKVVDKTNALKANMIALTGDLVDNHLHHLKDDALLLKNLTAPEGLFYVSGNHEYYWGGKSWFSFFEQSCGFHHLLNTHHIIRRGSSTLLIGGVPDLQAQRFEEDHPSMPQVARGHQEVDFSLLLAHRPQSCYGAAKAGFDAMICGHTHGGQFYPWNLVVGMIPPGFIKGLYRYKRTQVYVNRGTGFWGPPNRLGVSPEITHMTLTRS